MTSLQQVALVVGASRGIGRQIAIDLAKNNYQAQEITSLGYTATAIPVDTRDYSSIQSLVEKTLKHYKHLDVLIYNSGAIWWASVENTPMKRFQLMQKVNAEGLYGCVQACLPWFADNGWQGRIVVVCPPIYERFFRGKTGYAMGKVGMSVMVKGLAMDFKRERKTGMAAIESAATAETTARDSSEAKDLRKPTIFSDAILAMLNAPTSTVNGLLELDEDFLRKYLGVEDFSKYSVIEGATPRRMMPRRFPDLRVDEHDDEGKKVDSAQLRKGKL
ncbi:MAG: hypothetical protein Q9161_000192 [Pseudevernia consocians]